MRKILFHIVFFMTVFSASAQKDTSRPHLSDDKYQPKFNKALIYDQNRSEDHVYHSGPQASRAIKVDPILLLRKTVALSFEKQFHDIALEGTIGYSYGMDNLLKAALEIGPYYTNYTNDIDLPTLIGAASNNEYGGLYLGGSFRYYWSPDHFDGFYVGLAARRSKFGFDVDPSNIRSVTTYNWKPGDNTTVNVSTTAGHILYGYQGNTGGKTCFISEFYFGTGLRLSRYTQVTVKDATTYGYPPGNILVPGTGTNTKMGLSFIAGWIIGFGF
jgi:hypothetical protein